jgi:hypothetical protein
MSTTAAAAGREGRPAGQAQCTPFRFGTRRERIDWRLLHGVDVEKLVGVKVMPC